MLQRGRFPTVPTVCLLSLLSAYRRLSAPIGAYRRFLCHLSRALPHVSRSNTLLSPEGPCVARCDKPGRRARRYAVTAQLRGWVSAPGSPPCPPAWRGPLLRPDEVGIDEHVRLLQRGRFPTVPTVSYLRPSAAYRRPIGGFYATFREPCRMYQGRIPCFFPWWFATSPRGLEDSP